MGLDIGNKRIGVSISDPEGILATPLTVIKSKSIDEDRTAVLELAMMKDVGEIIVGIPISLDGTKGKQAKIIEYFKRELAGNTSIPVKGWDERLSTEQAERRLREIGVKPSQDKGRVDAAAAAIILQSYLDFKKYK
jgi:putative Holliday junction resolvase